MREKLVFILAIMIGNLLFAQKVITGKVIDSITKHEISYVHIGINKKNYGTISQIDGSFKLTIPVDEKLEFLDVYFSCIGYEKKVIPIKQLIDGNQTIELRQRTFELQEVVINSGKKKLKSKKIGGFKKSTYSTGESNTKEYGAGKEYGIKIDYPGYDYKVKSINFHLKYNTIDSVLFRFNIYTISKNGLPKKSILTNQLFAKSYKNDNLIVNDVYDKEIYINQEIIITIEPIHLWYDPKDDNQLFYSQSKGYHNEIYLRNSSFSPWIINVLPPFMIYLDCEYYK